MNFNQQALRRYNEANHMTQTVRPPAAASLPTPSASQARVAAPISQGYWAARKRFPDGREIRYWEGVENGPNTRAAGWYYRDHDGGWGGHISTLFSHDTLDRNAPGVELISRVVAPFAPGNQLSVVHEREDFMLNQSGRERSRGIITSIPQELQIERFSEIVSWCQHVDELIGLFEKNEKDVTKWRNILLTLSGTQILLGLAGAGLIIAGIVATGGLAAIPMAVGAIAIAASTVATGAAVSVGRSVAEVGLANALREGGEQHGKATKAVRDSATTALGITVKEATTRGLEGGSQEFAASVFGTAAGGVGSAYSVYKGVGGLRKATQIDVGAIWAQVHWNQALENIVVAEKFLENHSKGFDAGMLHVVKLKLKDTKEKVAQTAQTRWLDESRRTLKQT